MMLVLKNARLGVFYCHSRNPAFAGMTRKSITKRTGLLRVARNDKGISNKQNVLALNCDNY